MIEAMTNTRILLAAVLVPMASSKAVAPVPSSPVVATPLHILTAPARFQSLDQRPDYEPTHFAWSPDGRTLATGAENASLYFWDVRTGQRKAGIERALSSVYAIAYSPDGRLFATGTSQLVGVSLWDSRSGKLVRTLKEPYPRSKGQHVFDLAFAPDGKTIYVPSSKNVEVWDVASGKLRRKIKAPVASCGCGFILSKDGKRVATSQATWKKNVENPTQTILTVWNLSSGKVEHKRRNIGWPLSWSSDGSRLFTRMVQGSDDNRIGQWFVSQNFFRPVSRDEITASGDANPFDLSPDGRSLAVGQANGIVSIRGSRRGELLQTLRADKNMVSGLSFSPDGSLLATGSGQLKLWRVRP
jgi:WD40 repeat protein